MSLLLLVDGYNVVGPVAPPGRGNNATWLQTERMRLIKRLAQHLSPDVRRRTCIVFDAANPPRDRPHRFHANEIEIRFAVGYPEADDLIEEIIAAHSAPKQLTVVSSDHRVQTAARRRGATAFDAQSWLDDLLDGVLRLAESSRGAGQGRQDEPEKPNQQVEPDDVQQWMRDFGF